MNFRFPVSQFFFFTEIKFNVYDMTKKSHCADLGGI